MKLYNRMTGSKMPSLGNTAIIVAGVLPFTNMVNEQNDKQVASSFNELHQTNIDPSPRLADHHKLDMETECCQSGSSQPATSSQLVQF
jgi:hypothetical protein